MSDEKNTPYDCQTCTEKKRKARNCHNHKGIKADIILRHEIKTAPSVQHSLKTAGAMFFQCPLSVVTPKTWKILGIVNSTTDSGCNITMPYRGTSYQDQPKWYLQAVEIVKSARSKHQRLRNG